MIKVTNAKALSGYRLRLTFSDGTSGEAKLEEQIRAFAPFAPLLDEATFKRARVEHGAVTWPGDLDIATERLYALVHGLPEPETFEQAFQNELEMSLREIRKLSGTRQEELASELEVTQGAVSRLENGVADAKLATLRRYLGAIGWDIEVVAVKNDTRIKIRGV